MKIYKTSEYLEKLKIRQINVNDISIHKYHPKNKIALFDIILKRIRENGNNCNLNDIDVSQMSDMSHLFSDSIMSDFNGDISMWNVSNVTDMSHMFEKSKFNGNISNWDVSNVVYMNSMFTNSKFNGDISGWDVSNVKGMAFMFMYSEFNNDISRWDVSNVEYMQNMFEWAKTFNQDLSNWKIKKSCCTVFMFDNCPMTTHPEKQPKI